MGGFRSATYVCFACRVSARRPVFYCDRPVKCFSCGERMYRMSKDNPPKKNAVKKWKKLEEKHAYWIKMMDEYYARQETLKKKESSNNP